MTAADRPTSYRIIGTSVYFASDDVALLTLLDHLWRHCRTAQRAEHSIEIARERSGWTIALDEDVVARAVPAVGLIERVVWELNTLARASSPGTLMLHAGVVAVDGIGVVVCGASGAGKSTLVLGLCERGAVYLSDEIAPLEPGSATVAAYPKPITLRRDAWPLVQRFHPGRPASEAHFLTDTWYIAPPEAATTIEARLIVFPKYEPGATTRALDVEPADTVVTMCNHVDGLDTLGEAGFRGLAALARTTSATQVTSGSLNEACAAVLAKVQAL